MQKWIKDTKCKCSFECALAAEEDMPMRERRLKVWKLGFQDFKGINYINNPKVVKNKSLNHQSTEWLRRHLKDPYVKQSQKDNYRSRAAYKLTETNKKFNIFSYYLSRIKT